MLMPCSLAGCACILALGCAEVPWISPVPDLTGMQLLAGGDEPAGNVVIQFSNQTGRQVRWTLTWRATGEEEPGGALLVTEPGQSGTVTLTAGLEQVACAVCVNDERAGETARSWTVDGLQSGRHFAAGDIITFTLTAQEGEEATLSVEVLPGG